MEIQHQIASLLPKRLWVAFDLDDTLHNYRKASAKATTKTLTAISNVYGPKLPLLETKYTEILAQSTSYSLTDGKTSNEYLRERFSAVLTHFLLPVETEFLRDLVRIYEETMMESLEVIPQTIEALLYAKEKGCSIVVVTEGSLEEQERTVDKLGIDEKVDCLVTSSSFGVSKTDGFFEKLLNYLSITADDMVYIGDSEERDIVPARAAGILAIHFRLEE